MHSTVRELAGEESGNEYERWCPSTSPSNYFYILTHPSAQHHCSSAPNHPPPTRNVVGVWKLFATRAQAQKSSLRKAMHIGFRARCQPYFSRWARKSRSIRVMLLCKERNLRLVHEHFSRMKEYAAKDAKLRNASVKRLCRLLIGRIRSLAFSRWRREALLRGIRARSLARVITSYESKKKALHFRNWVSLLAKHELYRVSTASNIAAARLRSDSAMELSRQDDKLRRLSRDAGVALFFLSSKLIDSNLATIRLGWKVFKSAILKSKIMETRRHVLTTRVLLSQRRRAFGLILKEARERGRLERVDLALKKVFRLLGTWWKKRAVLCLRQKMNDSKRKEEAVALEKCRSVGHFVQLACTNSTWDYRFRRMWDRWVIVTRGAATLEAKVRRQREGGRKGEENTRKKERKRESEREDA